MDRAHSSMVKMQVQTVELIRGVGFFFVFFVLYYPISGKFWLLSPGKASCNKSRATRLSTCMLGMFL